MNPKQARFAAEYIIDRNATKAAERAGYSAKTAYSQGNRLLSHVEVKAEIERLTIKVLDTAEVTAQRVMQEIARLSFSDVRGLFDTAGNLKPIHELTPEQAACIASFEVIKKNAQAGDGQTDIVHKLKIWDKTRSLEMLAKHFALLTERIEHSGGLVIKHELAD